MPTMTTRARLVPWLAYAAFWLGVGLFFALAEWQHYVLRGGRHPWEPFLWETTGSLSSGLLAVAVYRLDGLLRAREFGLGTRIACWLAGAPLYADYARRMKDLLPALDERDGVSVVRLGGDDNEDFSDEVHPKPRVTARWSQTLASALALAPTEGEPHEHRSSLRQADAGIPRRIR
jgi:hypothetical protein